MRHGPLVLDDERIGRLLDAIVEECVRAARTKDEADPNSFPQRCVCRFVARLVNQRKRLRLGSIPQAGQLAENLLSRWRQTAQLRRHEIRDVVGITLGANAIQVPGPSPFTIVECEQTLLDKYGNQLIGEEWIARRLLMDQFCQRGDAFGCAVKRIPNQPPQVFTGERRKDNFVHDRARLADRFKLADQRMGGIDLVISVGPDQHQMLYVRLGQQILQQVQRCGVEPLQIVEEQRQWVLRPGEHGEKAPENQLKATLRVVGRQLRDRRLFTDDELQLRNQVYDKLPVRA